MGTFLLVLFGVVFIFIVAACAMASAARTALGVQCAADTATHHGWVNAYRIISQAGFSRIEAQRFLARVHAKGLLA